MATKRRFVAYLAKYALAATVLAVSFSNSVVWQASSGHLYRDASRIPRNSVALVLGTSPYQSNGQTNPFFTNRIDAATDLFRAGKVSAILASGDNRHRSYNEPLHMQRALIARGIPEEQIYLDYAGFRTLDSVVRASRVFGQRRMTIVSQSFHARRALFIAQHFGIDAVAYAAEDVDGPSGLRLELREVLARTLAVADLFILGTEPELLGDPMPIAVQAEID